MYEFCIVSSLTVPYDSFELDLLLQALVAHYQVLRVE